MPLAGTINADQVELQAVAVQLVLADQGLDAAAQEADLLPVDREQRVVLAEAYLDHQQGAPAAGDDVEFAVGAVPVAGGDAPAASAQVAADRIFGGDAALMGLGCLR